MINHVVQFTLNIFFQDERTQWCFTQKPRFKTVRGLLHKPYDVGVEGLQS